MMVCEMSGGSPPFHQTHMAPTWRRDEPTHDRLDDDYEDKIGSALDDSLPRADWEIPWASWQARMYMYVCACMCLTHSVGQAGGSTRPHLISGHVMDVPVPLCTRPMPAPAHCFILSRLLCLCDRVLSRMLALIHFLHL